MADAAQPDTTVNYGGRISLTTSFAGVDRASTRTGVAHVSLRCERDPFTSRSAGLPVVDLE
jgi:hypothetical protein